MGSRRYPIDHYIKLKVSDDKLTVWLILEQMDESFSCTSNEVIEFLRGNGIVYGIQQQTIDKLAASPGSYLNTLITAATGTAPQDGKDGFIRFLFDLDGHVRKPRMLEDGTVDYREMTQILNVNQGDKIAERILPEDGVPGMTVKGDPIPFKRGKDARLKVGKNVMTDSEQTALFSSINGVITRTDGDKINVFPIYEVNGDVDYNIGNIDFVGSVVIRGNVRSGFRVKASGDIRITGGVEAAELYADGSIEISGGILGQNKGIVKAGKNIKSSFIQEGRVEAGEDVIITQSIMHSVIRAGRGVLCTGAKGLIVGGTIQAGERVEARTIGNSLSTVTNIEVGVLPERRNELISLRTQLKENTEALRKTEQALALLDPLAASGQLSMEKMAMRIKLNHTKRKAVDEINLMKERLLELESLQEQTNTAIIEVGSVIYGGAKIVMGRYTRFIKDPVSRVKFRIIDGDIGLLTGN
ncbi:DUF342 domain-containing protein [Gorillibacterium timonense]|uniref:DUF342 domain-containing protein n=1 Tax=Gorillibacterium timonense TaxID=1689269 RepID=UPI00071D2598|nr:FapA family protein [Gorillibacterium timonense]